MSKCFCRKPDPGTFALGNEFLELHIPICGRKLSELTLVDKVNGVTFPLGSDVFAIHLDPATTQISATDDQPRPIHHKLTAAHLLSQSPTILEIPANPKARRLVDRHDGIRFTIPFAWESEGLEITWSAEIRAGHPYVRIFLDLTPQQWPYPIRTVRLLDFQAPDIHTQGSVQGSPATAFGGRIFAGIESPLSSNRPENGNLVAEISRKTNVPIRATMKVSAVLGVSNPAQIRRTFQLDYLNQERARPYGALLNYNTWYDSFFSRYDEKFAADIIHLYGQELVTKRGVVLDSILFDDGWDNPETLWEFNSGFPNEFRKVNKIAASYGAGPGVWFSPWGGYGQPKANRIAAAADRFETNDQGFALSGPKYYDYFKAMCLHMIRENGINHFKFDGTSGEENQIPGSRFGSDFEAIIELLGELREERSDLFVNLTTGTWSSPFWFTIADSIWRGGWDHQFAGEGSQRQKWITFRDSRIYNNNVVVSPLFPVNSLMTHGIIYTKKARGLESAEESDLDDEIWSGFASGTQMQEIYITPQLLTQAQWDTLANAAKWARANNDTLVDTHWIGGNPMDLQVYGWSSWSKAKGIIALRNPAAKPQSWSFDPAAVFELPFGAPGSFSLACVNGKTCPVEKIEAGKITTITLAPFEVLVLEATPNA